MTLTIEEGLSAPARIVKAYLTTEQVEDGLLEDVETIISSIKSDTPVDPPTVWIHEHPTMVEEEGSINLSQTQFLMTPFEFICVEYDEDPEVAASKAKNLATRVGASILKHFNRVKTLPDDPDRMFKSVRFNTFIPDGEVSIEGKSESVPACGLILDFVYPIQWMYCTKL